MKKNQFYKPAQSFCTVSHQTRAWVYCFIRPRRAISIITKVITAMTCKKSAIGIRNRWNERVKRVSLTNLLLISSRNGKVNVSSDFFVYANWQCAKVCDGIIIFIRYVQQDLQLTEKRNDYYLSIQIVIF